MSVILFSAPELSNWVDEKARPVSLYATFGKLLGALCSFLMFVQY